MGGTPPSPPNCHFLVDSRLSACALGKQGPPLANAILSLFFVCYFLICVINDWIIGVKHSKELHETFKMFNDTVYNTAMPISCVECMLVWCKIYFLLVKTNAFFIIHAQLNQAIITFTKMELPDREYSTFKITFSHD